MGADSPTYAQQVALHLGRYADLLAYRTTEQLDEPVQGVLVMLWETMGLMLAGMALFRAHMLTGEWAAGRYRKWAIVSFTVTIPQLAPLAAWQIGAGFGAVTVYVATEALSMPFRSAQR